MNRSVWERWVTRCAAPLVLSVAMTIPGWE
jgi:hypothetical protein